MTGGQTAQPAASVSVAEQRQLAQSIRQQMDLPPDEDDEAMKVLLCPFFSLLMSLHYQDFIISS